ncbi:MAG: DUF1365 domain-containing protein [Chromatiales bacterium]|nr:DUF1365 domain-containing protein [Chromatiales bacterium]
MKSRIYEGVVAHRRTAPTQHSLRYRIAMLYLDLDELPHVLEHGRLSSASKTAYLRFDRKDYLRPELESLDRAVREVVEEKVSVRTCGPIRVLTHPRYFGFVFNPATFYYLFDAADENLEFIVTEITNTPWGERHQYVLDVRGQAGREDFGFEFEKLFHVSPFMPMEQTYCWRFSAPDEHLSVRMETRQDGEPLFTAGLNLAAVPLTRSAIAESVARFPLMTAKVVGGIYWNALMLKLKGTPFHSNPKHLEVTRHRL